MLSDFAEERPIDGKPADITFMHYVRRYALLGIRRGVFAWCVAAYVLYRAQTITCGAWMKF